MDLIVEFKCERCGWSERKPLEDFYNDLNGRVVLLFPAYCCRECYASVSSAVYADIKQKEKDESKKLSKKDIKCPPCGGYGSYLCCCCNFEATCKYSTVQRAQR